MERNNNNRFRTERRRRNLRRNIARARSHIVLASVGIPRAAHETVESAQKRFADAVKA